MHLKQTILTFNLKLSPKQVRQFRGAIAQKAGYEHDLFHNHNNKLITIEGGKLVHNGIEEQLGTIPTKSKTTYFHRYPLIQYQNNQGYAQLVGIGAGANALNRWVQAFDGQLVIGGKTIPLKITNYRCQVIELGVHERYYYYRLSDWLPLRDSSFQQWQQTLRLTDKIRILEKALANNIIGFAKGIGWQIPRKFEVFLTDYQRPRLVRYRNNKMLSFDVEWQANLRLPPAISLGKGASEGKGLLEIN
ncbi:MAG: CRISPR-associated endonuclease Cas6 [Bacteroidota bacterium]